MTDTIEFLRAQLAEKEKALAEARNGVPPCTSDDHRRADVAESVLATAQQRIEALEGALEDISGALQAVNVALAPATTAQKKVCGPCANGIHAPQVCARSGCTCVRCKEEA